MALFAAGGVAVGKGGLTPLVGGKLAGEGFVVEHIIKGETIEEVLSRANHQVGGIFQRNSKATKCCTTCTKASLLRVWACLFRTYEQ